MDEKSKKQINTRFYYAVVATLVTFAYMIRVPGADDANAFGFLMAVALGFNVSKSAEHLYKDAGSSKSYTRIIYAVFGSAATLGYLFLAKEPETGQAFSYLMTLGGGLGLSKTAEYTQISKKQTGTAQ